MSGIPSIGPCARRGTALVTVSVVLFTIAAMAVTLTETAVRAHHDSEARYATLNLQSCAESAINMAFAYYRDRPLDLDALPMATTSPITLRDAGGTTTSRVSGVTVYADIYRINLNVFRIRAQATVGDRAFPDTYRREAIETLVVRQTSTVPNHGLWTDLGYEFKGSGDAGYFDSNPLVDSPEETAVKNTPLDPATGRTGPMVLASNETVTVQKPGSVVGDYGTDHWTPPTIAYDPTIASAGALARNVDVVAGASYRWDSWTAGTMTVRGHGRATVYIDGMIDFGKIAVAYEFSDGTLWVNQGNPDVDAMDSTRLNGNGTLGDIAHPDRFVIISAYTGTITLNGNADMGCVFFAPGASVMMRGNFDFYGAMVVHGLVQDRVTGNPSIMYDTNLAGMIIPQAINLLTDSWRTYDPSFSRWTLDDPIYNGKYATNVQ